MRHTTTHLRFWNIRRSKNVSDMVSIDEFIEHLYDLDPAELRRLAYEALLISDGPDHIEGVEPNAEARCALRILDLHFREVRWSSEYDEWQPSIKKP